MHTFHDSPKSGLRVRNVEALAWIKGAHLDTHSKKPSTAGLMQALLNATFPKEAQLL